MFLKAGKHKNNIFSFHNKPSTEEENLSKLEKYLHKTVRDRTGTEELTLSNLGKFSISGREDPATNKENSIKTEKSRPPYHARSIEIQVSGFPQSTSGFSEAQPSTFTLH